MSSADCFKFDNFPSGTDLSDIFTNNKNTVNPILPFGFKIQGEVNICVSKCGHTLNKCEDLKIENVINYGKMLVMVPKNKDCELTLDFDFKSGNINSELNKIYKLIYITFSCPSLIQIGDSNCDLQGFFIFKNQEGLYCILSTLYRGVQSQYDILANSLLSSLLNNNIPSSGSGGGSSIPINISDFFPQEEKDYYQFSNTEKNSNTSKQNILIKLYSKKLNISQSIVNNLKNKLFKKNSTCNYDFFNQNLLSNYSVLPTNLDISYVKDHGNFKLCGVKEKMEDYNEKTIVEEEYEEEEPSIIDKLTKSNLEEKKESYINFTKDAKTLKIYKISVTTEDGKQGIPEKIFKNPSGSLSEEYVDYISYHDLFIYFPDYDEAEIQKSINEFPTYAYKNAYWRTDYTIRLFKNDDKDSSTQNLSISPSPPINTNTNFFTITEKSSIEKAASFIGGDITQEDVFNSMKNFPNQHVNGYYVSYYYNKDTKTDNIYSKIMYIVYCVLIILLNFLFYRYIYFITNEDYENVSMKDDEIINNDDLKQLASCRLLFNLIFVFQIIMTIVYTILNLSNINSTPSIYSTILIITLILTICLTLYYGFLRLQFSNKKVSYAEHKSLKILLERNKEHHENNEEDENYILKVINLLKNYLFINDNSNDELNNLYQQLLDLKKRLDEMNNDTSNTNEEDDIYDELENIIEKLKTYIPENISEKSSNSRTGIFLKSIFSLFTSILNSLNLQLRNNININKKSAKNIIKKISSFIGNKDLNTDKFDTNNKKGGRTINPITLPVNKNTNNKKTPFTLPVNKNTTDKIIDNYINNDETEVSINGKIFGKRVFPDLNNENEEDEENELIEKDPNNLLKNLLKIVSIKNIFIWHIFIVVLWNLSSYIRNIIQIFDTSNIYNDSVKILFSFTNLFFISLLVLILIFKIWSLFVPIKYEDKFTISHKYFFAIIIILLLFYLWIYFIWFKLDINQSIYSVIFVFLLIVFIFLGFVITFSYYQNIWLFIASIGIILTLISAVFTVINKNFNIVTIILLFIFLTGLCQFIFENYFNTLIFNYSDILYWFLVIIYVFVFLSVFSGLVYLIYIKFIKLDKMYKYNFFIIPFVLVGIYLFIKNLDLDKSNVPFMIPVNNNNLMRGGNINMATGINTAEINTNGINTNGINTNGINTNGINTNGINTTNIHHIKNLTNLISFYEKSGNKNNKKIIDKLREELLNSL